MQKQTLDYDKLPVVSKVEVFQYALDMVIGGGNIGLQLHLKSFSSMYVCTDLTKPKIMFNF